MLAIYVIAMIATTWHFAYGIWLFAAKWGITPGDKARKKFGYVCALVGIALCLMGLVSIYARRHRPARTRRRYARQPAVTMSASNESAHSAQVH